MSRNVWLIKFGGSLLSQQKARRSFLKQVAALQKKQPLVLVHGGGPEITAALEKMKIKPHFVRGRRVTDAASMDVVEGVLSGQVNKRLVGELCGMGAQAVGLSGRDGRLLTARAVPQLGRVGAPAKARVDVLQKLLKGGYLPVVSSVAGDSKGQALNVNADEAAAALATALKATRLVYLTNVAGVLDAQGKTIPLIHVRQVKALVKNEVITGGMIPKVQSCRNAILKGVREIDIIDGRAGLTRMKGTRLIP